MALSQHSLIEEGRHAVLEEARNREALEAQLRRVGVQVVRALVLILLVLGSSPGSYQDQDQGKKIIEISKKIVECSRSFLVMST